MVVGVLAGLGVIIGALVQWYQFGSSNAFHLPVAILFDYSTTDQNPKLAYLLLACGIVGVILSFVRGTRWARFVCGAVALGAAIAFAVTVGNEFSSTNLSVTDIIGAGPWVTGISGLALLISPMIGSGPSPSIQ